jgi:hypothetical protein
MKMRPVCFQLCMIALCGLAACENSEVQVVSDSANSFQAISGADTEELKERWDRVYRAQGYVYGTDPAKFLRENISRVRGKRALVYPMEEGRNAVFMAKQGFEVAGIDFSDVALQKAKRLARENNVQVTAINADLNQYVILPDSYDLIVSLDFHRARLVKLIKQAVRKGGYVIYEAELKTNSQPADRALKPGELREAFKDFQILVYQERMTGESPTVSMVARRIN